MFASDTKSAGPGRREALNGGCGAFEELLGSPRKFPHKIQQGGFMTLHRFRVAFVVVSLLLIEGTVFSRTGDPARLSRVAAALEDHAWLEIDNGLFESNIRTLQAMLG